MQAARCLYVGHHLFGEDPRRNRFLSLLAEHYRARGFSQGTELPDYLPAMLRFASENASEAETEELIAECMIPALRKMVLPEGLYALPLRAALRFLAGEAA
jgi:nitrate reductase assembly molybdenum cofactor insertion protein NarJ